MFSVDIRKVLEQLFWRTYFERTFLHTLASEVNSGNDCLELFSRESLSKPPWLSNMTKIPVAFKAEA